MGDTETYTRLAARPMQVQTDGSRIGTTAEWGICATLIPAAGQECKDLTAGTVKLGDGTKSYAALSAIAGGGGAVDPVALAADPAFTGTYGPLVSVRRVSTSTTAVVGEVVIVDATGGSRTVTLPAAALRSQTQVKKIDNSGNAVLIVPDAGATIDGLTSVTVPGQFDSITCLRESATSWVRV